MVRYKRLRWVGLALLAAFLGAASWGATGVGAGGPCPPNCPPKPTHPPPQPGFSAVLAVTTLTFCPDGRPIAGALVTYSSQHDPNIKIEGHTNEAGQFAAWIFLFGVLPAALGDLNVTIALPGFEVQRLTKLVFSFPFFGTFINVNACLGSAMYPKELGCECDKIPVGFGLVRWFDTKEECEAKGIDQAWQEAVDRAAGFCCTWYKCKDERCPDKIHVVKETKENACRCEKPDFPGAQGWQAVCDLVYKTECCCVPRVLAVSQQDRPRLTCPGLSSASASVPCQPKLQRYLGRLPFTEE
jgi:hypothetical protein